MSDIFISYAREEYAIADRLAQEIDKAGWSVWWDHSLNPGDSFRAAIEEQLRNARLVIVLWSRNSVASNFVLDEASRAQRRGVLVPIIVDGISMDAIPLGFGGIHVLNLSGWNGDTTHEGYKTLINLLSSKIGSGETSNIDTGAASPEVPSHQRPKSHASIQPAGVIQGVEKTAEHLRKTAQAPAVDALTSKAAATLTSIKPGKTVVFAGCLVAGLALLWLLVGEIKQDWNLWLAVSIPAILFGATGLLFARHSSRLAAILLIISLVTGLIIFATAPG